MEFLTSVSDNTRSVLAGAGLTIIGVVLKHLWDRYRQRIVRLRWNAQYNPMAFATEDFGWGKIEILYNSVATRNLHIAIVKLQNTSSRDLANLQCNFSANAGTLVFRSSGQLEGGLQSFPWGSGYSGFLDRIQANAAEDDFNYWGGRSEFVVPVLNRGAIAEFKFLLSRQDHATPDIQVSCEHIGVKLTHQPFVRQTWGVNNGHAVTIGLLCGTTISIISVMMELSSWKIAAISWASGATGLLLGVLVTKLWRGILRFAD